MKGNVNFFVCMYDASAGKSKCSALLVLIASDARAKS